MYNNALDEGVDKKNGYKEDDGLKKAKDQYRYTSATTRYTSKLAKNNESSWPDLVGKSIPSA